jgi:hypothetical protein
MCIRSSDPLILTRKWPRINADDLLLLQFVLRTQDKSREIGTTFGIVTIIDLRFERAPDAPSDPQGLAEVLREY